jgi:predicted MFS family arabinose efflux permease
MARAVLPEVRVRARGHLDPVGSVTGMLGIGALVYSLGSISNSEPVTARTLGWIVAGLVLLGVFARTQRRAESPLVPRSLHRRWAVWQPIAVAFLHGAAINTPIVFYALFMQRFRHATPWEIGLGFLPCNIAIIAASAASSRLARQAGYRIVLVTGMALIVAGLLTLTTIAPERSYLVSFLPGWIMFGLGVGASQVGIVGRATEMAPTEERGVVGGLVSTFAQVGTAVGLALLVLVSNRFPSEIDGYRAAFATGSVLALVGLIVAIPAVRRDEETNPDEPRAKPATLTALRR